LRIAFVTDRMYPFSMGGAERRYWEIAKRLGKKHEIHFFTAKNGDSNLNGVTEDSKKEENFLVHYIADVSSIYDKLGRRTVYSALKFSSKIIPSLAGYKFDLIDATIAPIIHIFPLKMASFYMQSPFVCTVHEVMSDYWSQYLTSRLMGSLAKYVERMAIRLANKVIVVSKTSAQQCVKLKVPKQKIAVVPNGIDTRYINGVKLNSEEYCSDLVFVGRLVSYKGIDILLRAAKILKTSSEKDTRVHIIGTGPLKQHILTLIKEFGLASNVKLLDRVDNRLELIRYLKSSKLFVLPSFREGFSIAALEAMASGLPVITFNIESNAAREHVTDSVNGFKVKPNANDLASSIMNLLTNVGLREKMSRNAKNYSSKYDWDRVIPKLEKVYAAVAVRH
jgi:glycosyltransferase involved in cell wall biosynthesis